MEKSNSLNRVDSDDKIHIINPYNYRNKLPTAEDINKILKLEGINHQVTDLKWWIISLTHKSYVKKDNKDNKDSKVILVDKPDNCLELLPRSNETIEYLGDSIIGHLVAGYLFERFPNKDEGFMTKLRTRLVCGHQLSIFAEILGLNNLYLISNHVEDRCNGRNNRRIMEDAFESFIGAMYLYFNQLSETNYDKLVSKIESLEKYNVPKKEINEILNMVDIFSEDSYGYTICSIFIRKLLDERIDWCDLIRLDNNYKDQILKYFQQHFKITPSYNFVLEEGPPHDKMFTMSVSDEKGKIIGTGTAKTKKEAEQIASKHGLIKLGILS